MPETDSDTDPMALAGAEDTRTERQRMFELSKELWSGINRLARAPDNVEPSGVHDALVELEQKALALSLYLKEQAK